MNKKKAKEILDPLKKINRDNIKVEETVESKANEFSIDEVFDGEPKG